MALDDGQKGTDTFRQMEQVFHRQKACFSQETVEPVRVRMERLVQLGDVVRRRQQDIVDAVNADFGRRSSHETISGEIGVLTTTIRHLKHNIHKWAKPKTFFWGAGQVPGAKKVIRQPKGVVGVVSPWNYPLQLAMVPAVTALAAGNKVMIKPAEATPRTNLVTEELFAEIYSPEEVAVIHGETDVSAAFTTLAFDHLFFTGSPRVGRIVAAEAAKNLTPVTLELGGKSPCLMLPDANVESHVPMVALGKFFSAGQTCVAPDYLMVPKGMGKLYAELILKCLVEFYGEDPAQNDDYTSIATLSHYNRLKAVVEDARHHGADVMELGQRDDGRKIFPPTLLLGHLNGAMAMGEELFGPILPIVEYESVDEAVNYINAGEKPLALYAFSRDVKAATNVVARTSSGGAAINGTIVQVATEQLPFGGVGQSGYGAYHGEAGYAELSHERAVLTVPGFSILRRAMTPPYGKLFDFVTKRALGR